MATINLLTDASSSRHLGYTGLGIVVTGDEGVLAEEQVVIPQFITSIYAEMHAILWGIHYAKTYYDVTELHIRSDALFALEFLSSNRSKTSSKPLMQYYEQHIWQAWLDIPTVELHYIPRDRNYRADNLAREAIPDLG